MDSVPTQVKLNASVWGVRVERENGRACLEPLSGTELEVRILPLTSTLTSRIESERLILAVDVLSEIAPEMLVKVTGVSTRIEVKVGSVG